MFYNLEEIFGEVGKRHVRSIIRLALEEDEKDLTSDGVFLSSDISEGRLIAREDTLIVGLPLIPIIFQELGIQNVDELYTMHAKDGDFLKNNEVAVSFKSSTATLLKAERIILNFITHLSGVANFTKLFLKELDGSSTKLLDTRKTLPGHRYLEKYAVRVAGAKNHRMHLADMLMIKNNHVDAAGSISCVVEKLRDTYKDKCPPIIIECRNKEEVLEAVATKPTRILLDNMDIDTLALNLPLIPKDIEAEISGGVNLSTIRSLAFSSTIRPADYISVGCITHSAPIADFSLRINPSK